MSSEKSNEERMLHIPPSSLVSLVPRISYAQSFLAWTSADGAAIQASGPLLAPKIPAVLDAIYSKLLSFDITAKAFVPKTRNDADGDIAPTSVQELSLEHAHVKRQMSFLRGYILRLVRNEDWSPTSNIWAYLDKVAVMHTGAPGFAHRITHPKLRVEYIHMGLLLAWLVDIVVGAVMQMDLEEGTKTDVIRAWNKLVWIQNDLFARQYTIDLDSGERPRGRLGIEKSWIDPLLGVAAGAVLTGAIPALLSYGGLI